MKLQDGFYTALGTPIDAEGNCVKESLKEQIRQQTEAGASGMLLMGSMGMEPCIKNSAYRDLVVTASEANNGKLPLFVGAMDNSLCKVKERMDMIKGCKVDGIVVTSPFYFVLNQDELYNWFSTIADNAPCPIYLYDLPGVVKHKVTYPLVEKLYRHGNIAGIKSGDLQLVLQILRNEDMKDTFKPLFSNIDMFDYAHLSGAKRNLDGMFATTPKNAKAMYTAMAKGDYVTARKHLDKILLLRDRMAATGLFACFTYTMNLLGCSGFYNPDYHLPLNDEQKKFMLDTMKEIGELQ